MKNLMANVTAKATMKMMAAKARVKEMSIMSRFGKKQE